MNYLLFFPDITLNFFLYSYSQSEKVTSSPRFFRRDAKSYATVNRIWCFTPAPGTISSQRSSICSTLRSLCCVKSKIRFLSCTFIITPSLRSSLGVTSSMRLVSELIFTQRVGIINLLIYYFFFFAIGEQGVIIGILNSGVHIIMYFYYMVAAMGPQYQKYLWWKKYMTTIQLIQFVLISGYMIIVAAKGCNMPRALSFLFLANTIIFLYLFGKFYRNTYNTRKAAAAAAAANGHANGYAKGLTKGSITGRALLAAAGGMGCKPTTNSLLAHGDQMKHLIDVNNNHIKLTKTE